jgi:hypothetical protein
MKMSTPEYYNETLFEAIFIRDTARESRYKQEMDITTKHTARQGRNGNSEYLAQRRKGREGQSIVISTPSAKLRVNSERNLSQIPRIRSG